MVHKLVLAIWLVWCGVALVVQEWKFLVIVFVGVVAVWVWYSQCFGFGGFVCLWFLHLFQLLWWLPVGYCEC